MTDAAVTAVLEARTTKPHHLGRRDDATATSTIGSIIVGRALRLFVVLEGGKITDASFQVFSCREQVGVTDLLLENILGMTLNEAAAVDQPQVLTWLATAAGAAASADDIPLQLWGIDALHDILRHLPSEAQPADLTVPKVDVAPQVELPRICRCHGISRQQLEQLRDERGMRTTKELVTASGAGSGCGTCLPDIEDVLQAKAPDAEPSEGGVLGRMAVLKQAAKALSDVIATAAEAGVTIEPWDLGDNEVVLSIISSSDAPIQPHLNAATEALQENLGPEWQAIPK